MTSLRDPEEVKGATRGDVTWLVVLVAVVAVVMISIFIGVQPDSLNKG